jgi:uncharacterized membrane protein
MATGRGDSEVLLRVLDDSSRVDAGASGSVAKLRDYAQQFSRAWEHQDEAMGTLLSNSAKRLSQSQNMLQGLSEKYREVFAEISSRRHEFDVTMQQGSDLVTGALNRELEANRKLGEGSRGAYQQALKELAKYLAKKAELKGLEQVAEALSSWPNIAAMAEHFAAAAAWEALGAGVSAGVGAIAAGGGGATRGRSSYGEGRSRYTSEGQPAGGYEAQGPGGGISGALAPGAQPAAQPAGGLTVAIMGNEEAGQWLATTLNKAVTQQGVQLVSSASQRGAPVGH